MHSTWSWLTQTDAGLFARILIGVAIFGSLATAEISRKGLALSTRWREYSFLLLAVIAALFYGAVNDLITSSISWEFFFYGKGLAERLDPKTSPDSIKAKIAAIGVGLKATWTAGLLIGVAILIANNRARRPYSNLILWIPIILLIAATCGAIGGGVGYLGLPAKFSNDFHQMLIHDEMRPRRFMAVFGIHLGGYVGGLAGTVAAVIRVVGGRRYPDVSWEATAA